MFLNEIVTTQKVLFIFSWCLCFAVVLVLRDLYRIRHIFKFSKNFKRYRFYPIIGNAYYTVGKDVFTMIENSKKKHGLPCGIWNGHDYHYMTEDASEVKVILNNPNTFNKGTAYENFLVIFENTLILAGFDQWKRNRRIFFRSFNQPILNSFVDKFYEKACTLVDILKKSHSRDVYDIFGRLSLENFCANIMSLDLVIQKDKNNRLVHLLERYVLKDFCEIKNFIYKIIQQKKEKFKIEKEEVSDVREDSNKLPLMDMLLEAEGTTFTHEEISREIVLFLLAGTDTSGVTLAFAFTLLGMNPNVQDKVYQEVKQTVGLEGPISHSDLPKLKYTQRVLFEAMRLLPVVPVVERYADADVNLGDKIVPAGVNLAISIFNLHRSEAYWKDPLKFDPDRFLPEEVEKRHPYAFIPFSGGPRNCIGMKYGLMMMTTTVAHVIRNYEVKSKHKSVTDMEFESFITMKTVHKLDCSFIPRS